MTGQTFLLSSQPIWVQPIAMALTIDQRGNIPMNKFDPYQILGIEPAASEAEIKKAYKRRAKETHTDATGGNDPSLFVAVCRAYTLLMNPDARKLYDETGDIIDDPDRDRRELIKTIQFVFDRVLDQAIETGQSFREIDFVALMKGAASTTVAQCDKEIMRIEQQLRDLRDLSARIRRNDGTENIFAEHLSRKVTTKESELGEHRTTRRVSEMMITELESYSNEVELMRAVNLFVSGAAMSNSATWGITSWT